MKAQTTKCGGLTTKMIEVKTWKESQSVHFRKIMELGSLKVKIAIKRDSFAQQSYAVGYVFSMEKLEWNTVYSIPYPEMKTSEGLMYGNQPITSNLFTDDSTAVLEGLKAILF